MRSHKLRTVIMRVAVLTAGVWALLIPSNLAAQTGSSNFGSGAGSGTGSNFGSGSSGSRSSRGSSSSSTSNFGSGSGSGSGSNFGSSESGSRSLRDRDKNKDSDRKSSRRKSRKDKDTDESKPPQPAAAGVPARAAPQAASAAPGRKGGGGGGQSYLPDSTGLPQFTISGLIQSDSLFFSPAEVETPRGWRFSSPLSYYNAGGHAVSRLDLWIKYPPQLLDPVCINVEGLKLNGGVNISHEVYRDQGYVRVRSSFDSPMTQLLLPVATINWRAVEGPARAVITIEAPPGRECGIFTNDGGALYNPQIGNRGIVSLGVKIGGDQVLYPGDDPAFQMITTGQDPHAPGDGGRRGVRLGLIPASATVGRDEVSTLDVVLINPALAEFDQLSFRLRYNPGDVEILDADEDNYITRGVNIYDGGFHQAMPFDLHAANSVNGGSGTIEYSAGSVNGIRPYPSGTIARVVFRVKRGAGPVFFWFESGDDAHGMACDVRARGRSILGDSPGTAGKALHNVMLDVRAM